MLLPANHYLSFSYPLFPSVLEIFTFIFNHSLESQRVQELARVPTKGLFI